MPIIASIQLNSQDDINQNQIIIKNAVSQAAQNQAKLIVLPENACVMGPQLKLAERFDEMVLFYQNLAKTHGVYLVAGTLPCKYRPDGTPIQDKFRQTSLLIDPNGKVLARYDKIHLFRASVADGVGAYDEGRTFEAGMTPVVAPIIIDGQTINVGLSVCFDVRFPKYFGLLRQMGADIITVPSAFTYTTGQAHWQILLQARALDSQCMVVGSAEGGTHHFIHKEKPSSRQTWGHATIVNATGQIVASTDTSACDDAGFLVVYADFDKAQQTQIRQNMPIFECHRLA